MSFVSVEQTLSRPELPKDASAVADGQYVLGCYEESTLSSNSSEISAKAWFKSAALPRELISRIHCLKLLAETHDQGYADEPDAGNWTWLELAILEDETAESPRVKDGIKLVWTSHYNRFLTTTYGWGEGLAFDQQHDMLRLLEDGNVIAVRICARFPGWSIYARKGCLFFDIGRGVDRQPVSFENIVVEMKAFKSAFDEVNTLTQKSFIPTIPDSLFQADALTTGAERSLRVLSLDGGGVRGLASLHLLKAVFDKACPGELPCDVFDIIGGTSTGGLIAIMLGRLRMTIDECIEKYQQFMKEIFKVSKLWAGKKEIRFGVYKTFYDAKVLEKVIKKLVKEKLGQEDAELLDDSGPCKVFVLAVHKAAANNRGPVFLRSYHNPYEKPLLPKVKVWEAARATSAAPVYFDPIEIGGYILVDGSLGANNPLGWLWTEVLAVFGPARATDCFLSIGTGISPNTPLKDVGRLGSHSVEASFASVATNAEIINILFRTLIRAFAPENLKNKYWRLNVGREVPGWVDNKGKAYLDDFRGVGELDDIPALDGLLSLVKEYVKEQAKMIQDCAQALKVQLG